MFGALILSCVLSISVNGAPSRRLVNQINNVRKEMGYMNEDIATLFKSIEDINITVWSNIPDRPRPVIKNERVNESKMNDMVHLEQHENQFLNLKIARLLDAFKSEKRMNLVLEDRILKLKSSVEVRDNKIADIDTALQSVKRLNQQIERQNQLLLDRIEATEDKIVGIEKVLESETLQKMKCRIRLQKIEENISDFNVIKRQFEDRLRTVENDSIDMVKALESAESLNSQVLTRLEEVEDNVFELQNGMEVKGDNVSEISKKNVESSPPFQQITNTPNTIESCKDVITSGVYNIYFSSLKSKKSVYCDADTDGGGWIVAMRRRDGSVDFDRNWNDYKKGLGTANGEFWIGNDVLHELTKSSSMELRIDMETFDGIKTFAKYKRVRIGSEEDKYKLTVSGYSGTAGNSLDEYQNGMGFTTRDSDNDKDVRNCAVKYSGGWWFNSCFLSHLTGVYRHESYSGHKRGVNWYTFTSYTKSLKFADMKLRPSKIPLLEFSFH